MALSKGAKVAITAVVVVLIAVVAYSLIPYVATTHVNDLKNNQTTYIYGTVQERFSLGNFSGFKLNDSSGSVFVVWNGTLPAVGSKVMVHGTFREISSAFFGLGYFEATSVTVWPI